MPRKTKEDICKVCRYGAKRSDSGFYILQHKLHVTASQGCEVCNFILQGIFACVPLADLSRRVDGVKRRGNCFIWRPEGLLIHTRDEAPNRDYDFYVTPGQSPRYISMRNRFNYAD